MNHWKLTDKIGDVQFRKGVQPNIKWSDKMSNFNTGTVVRDQENVTSEQFGRFRLFEKIIEGAKAKEKDEIRREKETEEILIRQAPRML